MDKKELHQKSTEKTPTMEDQSSQTHDPKNSHTSEKTHSHKKEELQQKAAQGIKKFFSDKYNLAFILILIGSFISRLRYIGQESIWNDGAVHLWYAQRALTDFGFIFSEKFISGDYFTVQTLTAILHIFIDNAFLAGKIVALLFGLLGIVFMYLLGKEISNKLVGLLAAAILGFHHLFLFYGVRVLADAPLTSMIVVTLYCVVMLEKKMNLKWGILTTVAFIALMLTKGQGALLYIAFLLYIIIFKRKQILTRKPLLVTWLVPVGLIILASIITWSNIFGKLTKRLFGGAGLEYAGLNALKMFPWIFSWYMIIPLLIGIFFVLFYKKKSYYFALTSLIVYILFFEISVGTPEDRYILPILPIVIIFFMFALEEIVALLEILTKKTVLYKIASILFVVFICWSFMGHATPLLESKKTSYAGHPQAGAWVKSNVAKDAPIFVGSPRMSRAFFGRDYAGPGKWDNGGTLWYLRDTKYIDNKTAFEQDLNLLTKTSDVYLVIDIWEYTQPKWYFPISQKSINTFVEMGFEPQHVVERELNVGGGKQNVPVIFIFKKSQTANTK